MKKIVIIAATVFSTVATALGQVADVLSLIIDNTPHTQDESEDFVRDDSGSMLSILSGIAETVGDTADVAEEERVVFDGYTDEYTLRPAYAEARLNVSPLNFISNLCSNDEYHRSGAFRGAQSISHGKVRTPYMRPAHVSIKSPQWGRMTSGFGYRPRFHRQHYGVDFGMAVGDTVRVPVDGTIHSVAYERGGYGHYIVVYHPGGMETRYAHLSVALVREGEKVVAGQPIALSGNTGRSTGPHLHFETRFNGLPIDPSTVFDFSTGQPLIPFVSPTPKDKSKDTGKANRKEKPKAGKRKK